MPTGQEFICLTLCNIVSVVHRHREECAIFVDYCLVMCHPCGVVYKGDRGREEGGRGDKGKERRKREGVETEGGREERGREGRQR